MYINIKNVFEEYRDMNECFSKSIMKPNGKWKKKSCELYECKMCTKIFNTRYDSLVHNAQHIIIPLLRQQFQKCKLCSIYSSSMMDLKLHMCKSHEYQLGLDCKVMLERIDNQIFKNDKIPQASVVENFERLKPNRVVEKLDHVELIEGSGIIKEVENADRSKVNRVNEEVKNYKQSNTNVNYIRKIDIPKGSNLNGVSNITKQFDKVANDFSDITPAETELNEQPINKVHNELLAIPVKTENSFDESRKNKALFRFEDEVVSNDVINNNQDLPKRYPSKIVFEDDVIVSLDPKSLEDLAVDDNDNKTWFANSLGPPHIKSDQGNNEANTFNAPIGYDALVAPANSKCIKCGETFQNRLLLIKHETSHMRWTLPSPAFCPYCDRYIANGHRILYNHVKRTHPDVIKYTTSQETKTCPLCGLRYVNYERHKLNYHTLVSYIDKGVDMSHVDEGSSSKGRLCAITKTVYVCELCYSFFRRKSNCNYVEMGDVVFKGRKQCERCEKLYFHLKRVKRIVTMRKNNWKQKKKPLTNKDRLRGIRKRLKNMKYTSKSYFHVFYLSQINLFPTVFRLFAIVY